MEKFGRNFLIMVGPPLASLLLVVYGDSHNSPILAYCGFGVFFLYVVAAGVFLRSLMRDK